MFGKCMKFVLNYAGAVVSAYGTVKTVSTIENSNIEPGWRGVAETTCFICGSALFWAFYGTLIKKQS